jgi:hypothetical protein
MSGSHQHAKYRQLIYDQELASRFRRLTTAVTDSEVKNYIHYQHVEVFKDVSRKLGLFILVRRTNPESLKFINYPGFVPKPLLCKPKTADRNVEWSVGGQYKQINCAGLVVNPFVLGQAAFSSWKKCKSAMDTWVKYWRKKDTYNGSLAGIPKGFCMQDDLESSYYGCIMRTNGGTETRVYPHNRTQQGKKAAGNINMRPSVTNTFIDQDAINSLPTGCAYIHGDYDLYALVHKDDLSRRTAIKALFDGEQHIHGIYWDQFEAFVNGRIKIDMIQHGSQENFCGHSEEEVDIFAPFPEFDLQNRKTTNAASMREVFTKMFDNRQTVAG